MCIKNLTTALHEKRNKMSYTTKEVIKYAEDTAQFLQNMLSTYKDEHSSPETKKIVKRQLIEFMNHNLE